MPENWFIMQGKNFFTSLGYAFRGVGAFFRSELHAVYHGIATVAVITAGLIFQVTRYEWLFLVVAISLVFLTEIINTLLEKFMDLVHPQHHTRAGQIKDMAAASVLIATIAAIIIGMVVFIPYVSPVFFDVTGSSF